MIPTSRLPSTGADTRGTAHKALIVTAITAAALATQQAPAQIATDDFNSYSAGTTINGQSDGSGWVGAWYSDTNQIAQVVSTSITYDLDGTLLGGGNSLRLSGNSGTLISRDVFSSLQTGGQDYYLSFIFQMDSGGDSSTNGEGGMEWRPNDGSTDENITIGGLYADKARAIIGANDGAGTQWTVVSTDSNSIQQATTYFMVIGFLDYDSGTGKYTTAKTWLNPGAGDENTTDSSIVASATNANGGSAGFQGIALKTGGLGKNQRQIYIDDLKVGTTFDSVVDSGISTTAMAGQQTPMMGVNLAGAEFGGNGTTYGQDYIYPGESQLNYFHSKGLKLIRLPFKWHRIQPDLYGSLSSAELGRIDTFLDQAEARGMQVILDLHNYAGRTVPGFDSDPNTPGIQGYKIGDNELPVSAYKDVWKKMAAHFKTRGNIWAYGLMNEPSGISTTNWLAAVQAAVDGVREEDMSNYVLLPGTYWSNAHQWPTHGEYLFNVVDPADKRIFEAHSYWDGDHNGDYSQSYAASGVTPSYGVDDLEDFVDWCNANDVQGFVGEFGIDWRDPDWAPVLENALAYMEANGISGTYWAGGPWWQANYPLDLEVDPRTNEPRYPLDILAQYGDGTSQPYAPNFRLYGEGITSGLLYSYPYGYGGAGATVTVDPESTDQAKSGSRSFKVTYTLPSGSYANCGMHIENGVYLTDNINTEGHSLVFYVRGDTGANFNLRLKDVTGASGPQVALTDAGPAIGNSWQRYEIPLSDLVSSSMDGSEFIERVRLDLLNKDNTTRTFYIDNMEIVGPEYVPVVSEPPSSGILLSETFDNNNADGWVTNGGNWIVEYGEIVSNNAGHNIAWWDAPAALNWSDYTLSADVASTDNDGIGLAFYVQDEDNYYYVSMSKQDTKTRLYKMVDGSATLLATNHSAGYTVNQTYSLAVSIDAGVITVTRDGQTLLTKSDTTFTRGSVGLSSSWCDTAHHDNILVTGLPPLNDNTSTYGNNGNPWNIGSGTTRIEAEDFDQGGQGIAYNDSGANNNGGEYRTSEGVDLEACWDSGGGYNIGWTVNGEWLEYTIDIEPGTYDVALRVASAKSTVGEVLLLLGDGTTYQSFGNFDVTNTGGWQNWETITIPDISVSGGEAVLSLEMIGSSVNINWIEFSK